MERSEGEYVAEFLTLVLLVMLILVWLLVEGLALAGRTLAAHPTNGVLLATGAVALAAALAALTIESARVPFILLAGASAAVFVLACRVQEIQDDPLMDREWNLTEDILHSSWWDRS